eukprot:gene16122-7478_t
MLRTNNRILSTEQLKSFSRLSVYEFKIPKTRKASRELLKKYGVAQKTVSPCEHFFIPPQETLLSWKHQHQHARHLSIGYFYIESDYGLYNVGVTNAAEQLHRAREIHKFVKEELDWFSETLLLPSAVDSVPSRATLNSFRSFIHNHPYSKEIARLQMTASELAQVCGKRLLSGDHIRWLFSKLNMQQDQMYCVYANSVFECRSPRNRYLQGKSAPKRNWVVFNIFKEQSVQHGTEKWDVAIMRGFGNTGSHFAIAILDKENNELAYGDSLGCCKRKQEDTESRLFFSNPTKYDKYLHQVLAAWLAEDYVSMKYLVSSDVLTGKLPYIPMDTMEEQEEQSDIILVEFDAQTASLDTGLQGIPHASTETSNQLSFLPMANDLPAAAIKAYGRGKNKLGQTVEYFQCNRSGVFKSRVDKEKRHRHSKAGGSCRMDRNCTCTMRVTEDPSKRKFVKFCLSHYGHQRSLQYLWLSKKEKEEIAAKLKQGVSKEKDLANIRRAFGIDEVERHPNDMTSVLSWIQEWQSSDKNPILYYKLQGDADPQGNLAEEDFAIVIQTEFQQHQMRKFAGKGICYDFKLTSLLIVDEYGEEFPVAWCLSNREDFCTMKMFCEQVKQKTGNLAPTWFMSDIAPQFCKAFSTVYQCTPRQLYCTWHVDKTWQEQLRSKIKDFEIESQVYTQLRIVLEQTDERRFHNYLSLLCERLHNSSATKEFGDYFDSHLVSYASRWDYSFCCGLGINTNMFCEAFHRVFKYNYLKGKQNRRVDKCLVNLMKYSRDKNFERIIKLSKGKVTQRLKMIQECHQTSLHLSFANITTDSDTEWHVSSETEGRTYDVRLTDQVCSDSTCALQCVECKVCVHTYSCTCIDFLLYCTICKHIDLVQRQRQRLGTTSQSEEALESITAAKYADDVEELTELTQMFQKQLWVHYGKSQRLARFNNWNC